MRYLCTALVAIVVVHRALAAEGSAGPARPEKPNIVLIFIDDMGYGDIGPFGSKVNRTPHLDRMAKEGMKLTSFYAAPVCTPSRAQVQTGCYAKRVSLPNVLGPGASVGIHPDERTVAGLIKQQGYATMCIGKWHCGDRPEFLPTKRGFDHYFGIPFSNDMQRPTGEKKEKTVPLVRDDQIIEQINSEAQDHITQRYTAEATKFIRENKERPFFLYFPHTAVHVPIHPGADFRGKSANGAFGDWVEEVDWSVGQVLETLKQLKLDSKTLVMFSSDNGPWLPKGKDAGTAGPLRGGKGSTFEGGVRVPTLAWWPGQVPAASTCDAVAGNIDFLPTFVKLAGGSVPGDRTIDGVDLWPLLSGASKGPLRDHYYFKGTKLEAVRSGPWKLALANQTSGMGNNPGQAAEKSVRLYNLDEEIGETTDVSAKNPEVVKRLQGLIAKMDADLGVTTAGPGVREPGRAAGAATTPIRPGEGFKPVALDKLKIGDTLSAAEAPQVANTPFTITCEIEPAARDGVIVAHGGAAIGYALHLKAGKVVFAVRTGKKEPIEITADATPAGKCSIEARLGADGAMTLMIDAKPATRGKAAGLLARQPQENFCVGFDDKFPVTSYGTQKKFSGSIGNLRITPAVTPPVQP